MVKVISLSNEAYENLLHIKGSKESFSDVIKKLTLKEKKESILNFAGKWQGSSRELTNIFKKIIKERHKYFGRGVNL